MPTLPELQAAFAAGLLGDGTGAPALRPGRFPPERLLQVYRNNVRAGLGGALAAIYPVVARLVGEAFFEQAAWHYLHAHPSTRGNLHEYGRQLPEFLASFPPAAALAYLPDVARLEWAWHEAFHAADAEPAPLTALATVPAARYGELHFRLHPSARFLASDYPLLRIWTANQPDTSGEASIALDAGGEQLLIIRRGLRVDIEALPAAEFALLRELAGGTSLAAAAATALGLDPGFDLPACLARHAQARDFAAIHMPD